MRSILIRIAGKCLPLFLLLSLLNTSLKAQTSLVAGDIAFTGYIASHPTTDAFSFVLLKSITAGTVINFTDNGWLSTNVFHIGEQTVSWTSSTALAAGSEITIAGIAAGTPASTIAGAGNPGTCTGAMLSLNINGDQVLAYQGLAASPTFISAIHMNVYTTLIGDPVTTTAAAWDGTANTNNSSALPTGLTTGVNAIWIGTQDVTLSEKDNAVFNCAAGPISTIVEVKAVIYNQANWTTEDGGPLLVVPTGCNYINIFSAAPTINTQPSAASVCEGLNSSFSITATGAVSYQWQVDPGTGFVNLTNDFIYSGVTTTTLNITAATNSLNGYLYRCVATNGSGPTNSNSAALTVTALPTNPTLLSKSPATGTVADGTPVSATFNAGAGGTGCADDYRYTTNGGASYLPYTPGANISTTGIAAGSGVVTIEGRRANCSAGCQGNYVALASWIVTPLPAGATTLNAGDMAFSSYAATSDEFSFVLLRNIGPGTVINFTNNGWLSTNVFRTGEETVTWTSNAAYSAGTEIKISGLTATLVAGSTAGTVTGTALGLSVTGDQILAYRGSAAAPTFISAIHMNVYSTLNGDPVSTTAAAWDGTANSTNASALPTGLTTAVNAIWIGTQDVIGSEFDNGRYGNCANPATYGPIATLRAALNNQANWSTNSSIPPGFAIPTGCNYLGVGALPNISGQPSNSAVCEGSNTSFSLTVSGGSSYQWQVDPGTGFVNLTDDATYSGATTTTLNITAAPFSINNTQYRCIVTNGIGSVTSNSASLTLTPLAVVPTLLAKTPSSSTVADGTPVSASFNPGSGGAVCIDEFRYTTDGGVTYLPYTPGSNISTTGLAAGSGMVFIEGRRAGCSGILACDAAYRVLASWHVSPLPVAASTLNAGDIAFSSYAASTDEFSFVLLRNIGPGTAINFTNNGWLSTNVFRTGEETITWTAPAGGLPGGAEIKIAGLTATRSGGGAAGTVSGTALGLNITGDQILAYRGLSSAPTFITAIHMNVYTTLIGDAVTTTAAAWDGTANSTNASALPTGLTTGVNAIWIGTQNITGSEFDNAAYGDCAGPGVLGSIVTLRTTLNNQANWVRNNNATPGFLIPTGCNYLSNLCPVITVTNPVVATGTANTAFSQTFTSTGGTPTVTYSTSSTLPTGVSLSSVGVLSGTPTQTGTFPIVVTATDGTGCTGNGATYTLIIGCQSGITVTNPVNLTGTAGTAFSETFTSANTIGAVTYTTVSTLPTGLTLSTAGVLSGTPIQSGTFPIVVTVTDANGCFASGATYNLVIDCPVFTVVATPASQSACSGAAITAIILSGAPAGAVYNWTRDNTVSVTGIAANGSGNIGGTLTNNTGAPITVTFTITGTVYGCTSSSITATVVVNPSMTPFVLTGGNVTVCPGTPVTLSGPVDPNYTYAWSRSLSGILSPNSYNAFGGTASTQAITSSGNYRLVVTNQYGCSSSDTTVVSVADYVYNGSLAAGDAQQTGRLNRFAAVSTCAAPKACPLTFTTTGARWYDSYTITNPSNVPVCATIGTTSSCGTTIFSVAYTGSFDPTSLCTNYLADPGSSFPATGYYEATIPANGTIVVVVHEVNPGTGCAGYQLTVDLPRGTPGITVSPSTPVCAGTAVSLTSNSFANAYLWTPGGATTQNITVNPTVTTKYYVDLSNGNNGCVIKDSVTVDVTTLPTTALAGNDTAVCGLTIANLNANAAVVGTGTWTLVTGPGTVNFTNANNPSSGATATANGVYTLRWTIATGAPCNNTSADDMLINFAGTPTIAAAGTDKSACISPGTTSMTANAATVGTGVWTQVAGPATAIIFTPNSATTNIAGLNAAGTYTFRWTIANAPCTPSFDDVNIVVNGNPALFTLTGGGTVSCPSSLVTLSGPVDPNYTYAWGRSLTGIANPNSFNSFGGTASTQDVTSSGNYRLVVTNQFGCSASDTTVATVADYIFNGSLGAGDAQQTGRLNRFAAVSTCAAPKACPLTFTTTGARWYDSYTITNPSNVPVCATIGTTSNCGTSIFSVAYTGSYNPTALCTNYLADPGSSFPGTGFYEATIPANGTIVVVVHEVNPGTGCVGYQLSVDVPRGATDITVNPSVPVCGGAPVSLTANGNANSYLWTPGGATTKVINVNPAVTTKYKVSYSYGNHGCTIDDSATVVVNPIPTVDPITDQENCYNASTAAINFTGAVSGTTFSWTNSNPAIGLAASGNGNIPSFIATNGTAAPIFGTITVTPSANGCAGTPFSFKIYVANQASITSVTADSTCAPSGVVNLSATGNGLIKWYDALTGGNLLNTGNAYSPTISATTTYYVEAETHATPSQAIALPGQTSTFPGNTRGYWFTAPSDFVITALGVPTTASTGAQSIAVVKFNGNTAPPVFASTTNAFTTLFLDQNSSLSGKIPVNIVIHAGEVIGILGSRASINSYGPESPSTINGLPVTLVRLGMQFQLSSVAPQNLWQEPGGNISRVDFDYTLGTTLCNSTPRTPVTAGIIPYPDATATPAAQTICNTTAISTIVLTGTKPGTVYSWTRDNTANVTGIAASGNGNISGTLTNSTTSPITVTFTITPSFTVGLRTCVGLPITATVVVNPTPTVNAVSNQVLCNTASTAAVSFSGVVTGTVYNWTNNAPSIGLPANGTGDIASFTAVNTSNSPVVATITVTPSYTNGGATCTGAPRTFTITVNPTPTVNAVSNQVLCNAASTAAINFSGFVPGTVYNWTNNTSSIGLAASGFGNIPSFTANNFGTSPVIATITVTPTYTNGGVTCTGNPTTFTITVNPTPTVNAVANQVVCNTAATTAINFSGAVTGTVFNWTNTTTSIGLAASGTGNIASFTAVNTSSAPITATITVTPSYTNAGVTCTGTAVSFTITVNPTPTVNAVSNQTVCNGANTAAINFSGNTAGLGVGLTTYNWTNNNPTIGLAASGGGNIASFVANNTGTSPVTATIIVTPSYSNGGTTCTGTPITFTITVNPTPTVNTVSNQVLCNATASSAVNFSGAVTGTVFNWTNNTPSIGLAASGTGNIASFTAINTGSAPVVATITVTPTYTNAGTTCTGSPITFTITVNPTPSVNLVANQGVCNGTATAAVSFSGAVTGTVYSWTNNAPSIGLPAAGVGNIGSFVAINTGAAPIVATITVTPTYTNAGVTCTGAVRTFTITVNPTPTVNAVPSVTVCNNTATSAIAFSGAVTGTVYNWTNSNTAIGLAASGTGNIGSFTAINTGTSPISATIIVTPTYTNAGVTCTGGAISFTIIVNPTPVVNAVSNQALCHNTPTAAVSFSGAVPGTVFNWTNSNASIGLASSGTGNIPSFVATNTSSSPVIATITVTPVFSNNGLSCAGTPISFTIRVNPLPNINFATVPVRVCLTDTITKLRATPAGGTWSGRGVTGDNFNATTAGLGVSTISYTVTDVNGCTATEYRNLVVQDCQERHNKFEAAVWLYPNPSNGQFNVKFNTDLYKEANIRIMDATGRNLKEFKFINLFYGSIIPLDVRSLPGGTYILQIYNASDAASFRFVIAR